MATELPVLVAQKGFLVGDITGNTVQEFDASTVHRVLRPGISMSIRRGAPDGVRVSRRGFCSGAALAPRYN